MTGPSDNTATTEVTDATPIEFAPVTACLVVIYDADKENVCRRVDVGSKSIRIGRDASMDFVLDSEKVSRKHARIETSERGSAIIDEGSTNGTFVNDQRLAPGTPYLLRTGAQIRMGRVVLRYLSGNDLESQFQDQILRLTEFDTLTGLHSRRHFFDALSREVTRCKRYGRPLSLLAIDVDHFKSINDTLGHEAGDDVLRFVAKCMSAAVEPSALCARRSGDELAILLPETSLQEAIAIAESLRAGVHAVVVPFEDDLRVTVSIGCAEWSEPETDSAFLKRCDDRLYDAKGAGRDRVCFEFLRFGP